MEYEDRKYRSDETWAEVRRAWEQGETGASLAKRYDVGLANLWRRRAAEGWERRKERDPVRRVSRAGAPRAVPTRLSQRSAQPIVHRSIKRAAPSQTGQLR